MHFQTLICRIFADLSNFSCIFQHFGHLNNNDMNHTEKTNIFSAKKKVELHQLSKQISHFEFCSTLVMLSSFFHIENGEYSTENFKFFCFLKLTKVI